MGDPQARSNFDEIESGAAQVCPGPQSGIVRGTNNLLNIYGHFAQATR
jgi:hypothetical protein